jgi:hypothetical protein
MKNKSGLFGLPSPVSSFTRACSPAKLAGLALIASAALASHAGAAILTLNLDTAKAGEPNPSSNGSLPWIVATFADTATAGTVRLTIDPSGIQSINGSAQFVTSLTFNLKPSFANPLTFTFIDPTAGTPDFVASYGVNNRTIGAGGNDFKGFDILLDLPTSNPARIEPNEKVIVDISATGLDASAFDFPTLAGYFAAAHIQGLSGNPDSTPIYADSSSFTPNPINVIPEPGSTAALMGLLSCGLFLRSRRTRTA